MKKLEKIENWNHARSIKIFKNFKIDKIFKTCQKVKITFLTSLKHTFSRFCENLFIRQEEFFTPKKK